MTGPGTAARRWPLGGIRRAWYRTSWVICAVVLLGGLGLTAAAASGAVVLLAPAVVLLLVAALIGVPLFGTARTVELDADGALRLDRLRGPVRTHAARVRRVRRSAFVSGRNTPVVVETADGTATLLHSRRDVDELVEALRRHNPGVRVDV